VNDADFQPPFILTARLNRLTIKVDWPRMSPEDINTLGNTEAVAVDGKPTHHMQSGLPWFRTEARTVMNESSWIGKP
jgi:hypothetical protein